MLQRFVVKGHAEIAVKALVVPWPKLHGFGSKNLYDCDLQ